LRLLVWRRGRAFGLPPVNMMPLLIAEEMSFHRRMNLLFAPSATEMP
jgi:hypothetical protein